MSDLRLRCAALLVAVLSGFALPLSAQTADAPIQLLLQEHGDLIAKSSRKTIGPAIDALASSELPEAQTVLEKWQAKEMWRDKETGLFVYAEEIDRKTIRTFDFDGGVEIAVVDDKGFKQLKPNSGIRGLIGAALVRFQLSNPDPVVRTAALDAIERDADETHLAAIRAVLEGEADPDLSARMSRLERLLTIEFDTDEAARVAAVESFAGDLGVDVRAALTPLTQTRFAHESQVPDDANIKRRFQPGDEEFPSSTAFELLIAAGLAEPLPTEDERKAVLIENIEGGSVAGFPVHTLNSQSMRDEAYAVLASEGVVAPWTPGQSVADIVAEETFVEIYAEPSAAITAAAETTLADIENQVAFNQALDLGLDALSLASIYFLAAIGLAITFGVMGVINMAHGEFIMMGAYTGYVVQLLIPDYTLSIIVAIPLAFAVTFAAGVAMERLVIRWLYHRPLETLLATFGISIALQQLAKNIFGTQARPLTAPGWLDGSWVINDVVSISYIRIAIFVLALLFLALFLLVMNKTRLGLEVRAVTQNPRMAASMGINPDRINMLTFGFGSGIAGIAGVAIGLYAKVTSEMGADYIVQSFMTVVVGGVGNIWGTLLGATLVGTLQKGIEWLNPSNTLAAQTYMILFIILFIQFRPRGIIALKGRAAAA